MLLSLFTPRSHRAPATARRSVMSFAHDGVELARVREDRRGLGMLPFTMIGALLAFAFLFRIALLLEKGAVGYGQMIAPLADKGAWGEALAGLLLPDQLTMAIVEMLSRLM